MLFSKANALFLPLLFHSFVFIFWTLMLFYGSLLFFSFLLSTLDRIRDIEQLIGQSRCVTSICFMREGVSHNWVAVPHKLNGASGLAGYSDAY